MWSKKTIKKKLGIKGDKWQPGEMLSKFNAKKFKKAETETKAENKGENEKTEIHIKGRKPSKVKIKFKRHKIRKPKPQGKGIVKALGQKGTTGNFAKIQAAKGKGAAISALQNKLAKRRGKPIPFGDKKHCSTKKCNK